MRVEPELRAEVEALLADGETLSEFVESSVRHSVAQRCNQAEFVARALRALENTGRTGQSADADVVLDKLARRTQTW